MDSDRTPPGPTARRGATMTLATVLTGLLILPMLVSGTTVALPRIGADLHATGAPLQWVITGYFLTASCLMLVAGSLADLAGRRRVFRLGAVAYSTGAALSAAAGDIAVLNAARVLTGAGAAAVMACGGALLATAFHGRARTRAFAAAGVTAGVGLALGPTLTGWAVDALGWRACILAFAAAGVAVLAGTTLITESRAATRPRFDPLGAATFTGGLALLMYGITRTAQAGWTAPTALVPAAAGTALLAAFPAVERRVAHPLLDLGLIRDRRFAGWCLAAVTMAAGTTGTIAYLPTYLQGAGGAAPGTAGTTMLLLTAPVLVVPPLSGRLVNRGVPARALITTALLTIAAGDAWLTALRPGGGATMLAGPLVATGTGFGLAIGIVDAQAMSLVAPERAGTASGLLNTVKGATGTLTIAVFGAALLALTRARVGSADLAARVTAGDLPATGHDLLAERLTGAWRTTLTATALLCAVAAVTVHRLLGERPSTAHDTAAVRPLHPTLEGRPLMPDRPLHVAVIVGSVRTGRLGPTVAHWFAEHARRRPDITVDLIDLADHPLPADLGTRPEPGRDDPREHLAAKLAAADAFVIVTPEYNHSFPAALKHAIDWHAAEWRAKPVGFVSYGGVAGGLRAVEHLRLVFAELHAVTIRDTVSFHTAWERFGDDGRPLDPTGCDRAAKVMLDQLTWWARALRDARNTHPYAA